MVLVAAVCDLGSCLKTPGWVDRELSCASGPKAIRGSKGRPPATPLAPVLFSPASTPFEEKAAAGGATPSDYWENQVCAGRHNAADMALVRFYAYGAGHERSEFDYLDRRDAPSTTKQKEKSFWQNKQAKIKQVVSKRCPINRDDPK
jgi:hypothetical protein